MGNNNLEAIFKKKDNVVMAAMVLLSLWFANSIYKGQIARYESIKGQIETEKEKSSTLNRILALNEKIKKSKEKSWDTLDTNSIIDKIYSEGIEFGLKIRSVSPGARVDDKNYVILSFSIDGDATYRQFERFIKRLETYPMLTRIKSFIIIPISETGGSRDIMLRGSIVFDAVYLK